jgi:hypothetical protein
MGSTAVTLRARNATGQWTIAGLIARREMRAARVLDAAGIRNFCATHSSHTHSNRARVCRRQDAIKTVVRTRYTIASLVLILVTGAGCRSREKRKSRYDIDGGYITRKECFRPIDDCWTDCETRFASRTCVGCCRDQQFLCNTQQPHSFESCKSAE